MTNEFQYYTRQEPERGYIKPGYGLISSSLSRIWTVVGSSVAVTLFDRRLALGGMTHFIKPYRRPEWPSTALFAAPAIHWLLNQLRSMGSKNADLEAQVFGGACLPDHPDCEPELHEQNIAVGLELLRMESIRVETLDVGGNRGRKVIFHPLTGESAVARVDRIRLSDWYPRISGG